MPQTQQIVLGAGIFSIGTTPVARTRGGGQFVLEREYRHIEADGDKGEYKGRHMLDKSTPKLTMNLLTLLTTEMKKMYPGLKSTTVTEGGKTTVTGTGKVDVTDYQDIVTWTGKTNEGKSVVITLKNAINLENFDWTLADKDEVIASLTYTGCYLDDTTEPQDEPWTVEFV